MSLIIKVKNRTMFFELKGLLVQVGLCTWSWVSYSDMWITAFMATGE